MPLHIQARSPTAIHGGWDGPAGVTGVQTFHETKSIQFTRPGYVKIAIEAMTQSKCRGVAQLENGDVLSSSFLGMFTRLGITSIFLWFSYVFLWFSYGLPCRSTLWARGRL